MLAPGKLKDWWLLAGLAALAGVAAPAADSSTAACNRACLRDLTDKVVASMVAHDPSRLPLSQVYAATENSVPSALNMMVIWRTATASKSSYYVIDPESHQVFLISTIAEGPNDSLLFGRIKFDGRRISEVELFENRSRGQGGFQFEADGPAHFPREWTVEVPTASRATREELLRAGQSIFDTTVPAPEAAMNCVVMENGKVVGENPDVLKAIGGGPQDEPRTGPASSPKKTNPDGTVPVPCGNPPNRPTDRNARTTIIDEERGIVVSMAMVPGVVEPYLVTSPTESASVPNALLKPYADMLRKQRSSGKFNAPALRAMQNTAAVSEVHRIYDGKLQGLHLLVNLGAPGARSPWVGP
jgi:hypothetical protein